MRRLALGLMAAGLLAGGLGLAEVGQAPHLERLAGLMVGGLGLVGLGVDAALRWYLRRAGLEPRHVAVLQGALRHGQERGQEAIAALRDHGLPGRATILEVVDTGQTFNQRPEVDLELEVTLDDRPSYRVRQRHLVPAKSAERLKPGEVLQVRVDPEHTERMLIDWEA